MFTCAGFQARLFKVVQGFTVALLALSTQAQQENGATPPVAPSASSPNQRTEDPALLAAMRQKNWPRALQLLDAQLTARPNDALSHYRRGEVLTHLDRRENALLAFERSVQLAPRAELAWIELCWQQMLAGRPGQARAACERSVALEKTHITTLNLGHTYLLQGDAETAHQWYRETLSLVESQQQFGDGPVADFDLAELVTKDFSRLDQFTLSACNTATGGGVNENGAEVEGLATTVLREGRARAVMATLCKVTDDSTAQLMRSFYSLRAQAQPLSRAQALRQAQLTMLEGTPRPNPASSRIPDADRQASRPGHPAPDTGVQPVDPARPFAHPYFWAPFVLTGSWL